MHRLRALLVLLVTLLTVGCEDVEATTVVLWHAYRGDEERAVTELARAFELAHPGTRVELLSVPFEAYLAKLEAAAPHGHGPDLFIDAHGRLGAYRKEHVVAAIPADVMSEHYDAIAIDAVSEADRVWAVPLSMKCVALYRSTRFVPNRPDTLEDLLATPVPATVFPLAYEATSAYYHSAFLSAFGAEVLDHDNQFAMDSEGGVRSLELVRELSRTHAIPSEPSGPLVTELFASGQAAAVIGGPWLQADLAGKVDYTVEPLPRIASAGGPMRPLLTVEAAMLTPHGATRPLAVDLLRFLASREAALVLAKTGHQIVARTDAWDDPALANDATLRAFHEAVRTSIAMPTSPSMQAAWVPANEAIQKALRGEDPREALREAHRRWSDATKPPPPPASPTPVFVLLGIGLLALTVRIAQRAKLAEIRASLPAYRYVAHAVLVLLVLVVLPLVAGAATSLFAGSRDAPRYVGFANYTAILTARGGDLLGHGSFYLTLLVTVLWTVLNVTLHVGIGLALGVLLSRPLLRLRAGYRALLVLPWAVPSYVTALAWKGMFHRQFGAINALLDLVGVAPVSWFSKFGTALTANIATNVWLGFPFMMVVTLGALTSIPKEVLEAAEVDGATRWQRFVRVTLPLLRPALLPAVVLGGIWTFNMFNVVFLVSGGEPDGKTDILVSEAYRWAFTRDAQYGYAAAYAVLIFGLLWLMTRATRRWSTEAA